MDPAKQVLVKKADRLRIVKMDAVVEKNDVVDASAQADDKGVK
jgi:NADH-quinone oxidoreductase subunit J